MEMAVQMLLWMVLTYLMFGAAAAIPVHAKGLNAIDHGVRGASLGFRVLVTPGLILLWPVVLLVWRKAAKGYAGTNEGKPTLTPSRLRKLHGLVARMLAVTLPLVVATALTVKQPKFHSELPLVLQEPAALSAVVAESNVIVNGVQVSCKVRSDSENEFQLELKLDRALGQPALGVYWQPESTPAERVYLGAVWGPGTRRYRMTGTRVPSRGVVSVYSFADAADLARTSLTIPAGSR
ncbi:MAG TPA: hypothetical protein PLJ47_01575 [Candidatus Hydrogenedentes bacterium]|nr:hypothetical protein [Candidatus Hydrogenedentota bacterium]